MTVLVTGATGFIGSAVARQVLDRGERVRVIARPGGDRRNLADLAVEIVEGDLRDPACRSAATRGITALYHVAADYRLWVRDPAVMYATNVDATVDLLRRAVDGGARRLVYTSSVATLGLNADGSPSNENTPVSLDDMVGPYKRSKFLAEEAVRKLAAEGLPVVIVNPTAPVGPRDVKPTPTGRTVLEAAAGRMPAFVDTGLNLVHVDDVATGHLLAHDKGAVGARYILGGENLTLQQILGRIAALTGGKAPRLSLPIAAVLPIAYVAEAWARISGREPFVTVDGVKLARKKMFFAWDKAARDLGYKPRPVDDALRDAIAWFKAAGML
ncbi:MAG: NAD-dependent epimerase/dehydratase family protein [Rhodospirillaceae bacterium]|nr:MAG: NAD-dependent epimerase/dehydratase family protein [Rhodospirillaceae bacterium]